MVAMRKAARRALDRFQHPCGPQPEDDVRQARLARTVLASGDIFVPKTVVLELERSLRGVAEQAPSKVLTRSSRTHQFRSVR